MSQEMPGVTPMIQDVPVTMAQNLPPLPSIASANATPQTSITTTTMSTQSQSQPQQTLSQVVKSQSQQSSQPSSQNTVMDCPQFLTKTRLQDLVKEVDPTEQLDEEVEEMLLQLADDFVETTINAACLLAKHRHANTVEVKDVQLHLEKNWNMWIPGFGTDEIRPYKRATVTEAHKQRLALIRKSIKKY